MGALADEQGAGDHISGVAADQRHLSGEGCAGEIQLKVFPLEQLNVLPQGVEGKIHSF